MAYSIVVGSNDPEPLATTQGWKLFKQWARTLPLSEYNSVVHLAHYGYITPVEDLSNELAAALKAGSHVQPTDKDVRSTAESLVKTLREGMRKSPESEVAFVSDGMKSDDD